MIRTLLLILFYSLGIILVMPWLILWTAIVGNPDFMYRVSVNGLRVGNWIVGLRVRVEGLENIPPVPCVFIANHNSNTDPLALTPSIARRLGFLIKREVFRIPIFSIAMRQAQFIPVDRGTADAKNAVDIAARNLKAGLSYVVFAEGTRSPDGHMGRFRKGAFTLAADAGVPIVPVSIAGTQHLMKKGSQIVRPGNVSVRFGSSVDTSDYTLERRAELIARVESLVAKGLPPEQKPLP